MEHYELFGRIPCVVKLPLESLIESQWPRSLSRGCRFEPVEANEDFEPQADLLIGTGYDRLRHYDELLGSEYRNPIPEAVLHPCFQASRDPRGRFAVLGCIALILAVDTTKLAGRPMPESWRDVLDPMWEKSVLYPEDESFLENTILPQMATLEVPGGTDQLRRNLLRGVHPSQMQRRGGLCEDAALFIMPYFFAELKSAEEGVALVWPKEGAIASPVFMTAKHPLSVRAQELLHRIQEPDFSRALSAQGRFPSAFSVEGAAPEGALWFRSWASLRG